MPAHADDVLARRLIIRGHVQGVFFRDSTRREAERRGVAGWARNRPDGAVEVVLEGRPADVEAVTAFCRRGPRGAHVEDVREEARAPEGLDGFRMG
jgi:acylphosphatase